MSSMDFSKAKTLSLSIPQDCVVNACMLYSIVLILGRGHRSAGIFIVDCLVLVLSVTLQTQTACQSRWSDAQFLHISLRKPQGSTLYRMTHL